MAGTSQKSQVGKSHNYPKDALMYKTLPEPPTFHTSAPPQTQPHYFALVFAYLCEREILHSGCISVNSYICH